MPILKEAYGIDWINVGSELSNAYANHLGSFTDEQKEQLKEYACPDGFGYYSNEFTKEQDWDIKIPVTEWFDVKGLANLMGNKYKNEYFDGSPSCHILLLNICLCTN